MAVESFCKKIIKKPDDPYKDGWEFPETDIMLIFKNKKFQALVSIGLDSPRIRPIVFVLNTGTVLIII